MKAYKGMKKSVKRAAIVSTLLAWGLAGLLLLTLTSCGVAPEDEQAPADPVEPVKAEVVAEVIPSPAVQEETPEDKLQQANRIDDCLVTYYCCELYPHICGTGDGITASGAPVEAGVSCAVDPSLIPLGSTVWVDYGDGELHEYIAQDVGGWVNGAHIDLAVATHDEALQMGRKTATVYWLEG
jgi:3D (Asp-Asp-Asp) domain-containing protein